MAAADPVRDKAGPSRPGVRPKHPSRHHLEPNPFEKSFSSKPADRRSQSPSSSRGEDDSKLARKVTHAGDGSGKDDTRDKGTSSVRGEHAKKHSGSGPLTPGSALAGKGGRILPPVSSIASPAAQEAAMHYPWGSSLSGSLRAGPLSPAMLAGPQNFDSFRTGFTPDLSNFKTGLTPLGAAGGSFPPPSPNTAAFLAMMNSTGGSGLSGAAITPGTLSALTGNPMDAHGANHSLLASQPAEGNRSHGQGQGESGDYGYFGRSANDTPGKISSARMTVDSQTQDQPDQSGSSGPAQRAGGAGGSKQAASGLFLLSQAHQELSKREESAAQHHTGSHIIHGADGNAGLKAHSLYSDVAPIHGKSNTSAKALGGPKGGGANAKRKKSASDMDGSFSAPKAAGKKAKAESADLGSPDYESDELGDEMPSGNYVPGKAGSQAGSDGGNDEEKRKNFLERNRQAALKCRQRKKAWLASLQAKVEYLQSDNEGLQATVGALRNEMLFYKSQLMQAQRQLAAHGLGPPPSMDSGPAPGGMVARGSSGPMEMSGTIGLPNGMPHHAHHMGPPPPQQQQQQHAMGGGGMNGQYAAIGSSHPRQPPQGAGAAGAGPLSFGASGPAMKQAQHGARQGSMQAV